MGIFIDFLHKSWDFMQKYGIKAGIIRTKYQYRYRYRTLSWCSISISIGIEFLALNGISISIGIELSATGSISIVSVSKKVVSKTSDSLWPTTMDR